MPTLVIGAGAWGTALAIAMARSQQPVLLWAKNDEQRQAMQKSHRNDRYLAGISFPESLTIVPDLEQAVRHAQHILIAVPSSAFSLALTLIRPWLGEQTPVSWATKGLSSDTGQSLYETALSLLGKQHPLAIISGPSFAMEVAKDLPTAITVAAKDEAFGQQLATALHRPTLRIYTSTDIQGVQIGGTVKNILAIATGISDGLGFGANARAALITRGLAESIRLATKLGAEFETMMGLSGVGDLILTCTDDQSRNRRLGLAIGRGASLEKAMEQIGKTVEGVHATQDVIKKAQQINIEMPIVEQVHNILFNGSDPKQSVQALLYRERKTESSM